MSDGKNSLHCFQLTCILLLLFQFSCASDTSRKEPGIPAWLTRLTQEKNTLCAMGMSGPTFYRDDAMKNAAENARTELARTLKVEIDSIMIDVSSEKNSGVSESSVTSISSWATKAVVEGSYIKEYWHDHDGKYGKKNYSYALACMERNHKVKK